MFRRALTLSALSFIVVVPSTARAQSCSVDPCSLTNQVRVSVPTLVSLTVSSTTYALTAPVSTDFAPTVASVTEAGGPTLTVRANTLYNLTVSSAAANWTPGLGAAGYSKPASDLQVRLGAGAFATAGVGGAALASNQAATGSSINTLFYRTSYNFVNDIPDSYSLTLSYTIAAP